jgi:PAS domain S-box-containing protein
MSLSMENSAARLAAIVASSDDAIVSKDLNGRITSWNAAAERMFGWTADEIIGKSITILIPADRQAEEEYVLSQIRQGNVVDHFETVRQRKDGSLLNISVTISPIHGPDGTVVGASKIARDVTEQLRLRQAAEEASRQKDEFLATLSHELRTPLNTVLGYAAMLEKGTMGPDQQSKAIEVIHRNALVLADLVSELLDTSRIVTGQIRLNIARTDLSSLATEAVENIRPSIATKGIGFDVRIGIGSGRSCGTCSPTPSSSRRSVDALKCGSRWSARTRSFPCATRGSAYHPMRSLTSSNGSGRQSPGRPANIPASDWAWPWHST